MAPPPSDEEYDASKKKDKRASKGKDVKGKQGEGEGVAAEEKKRQKSRKDTRRSKEQKMEKGSSSQSPRKSIKGQDQFEGKREKSSKQESDRRVEEIKQTESKLIEPKEESAAAKYKEAEDIASASLSSRHLMLTSFKEILELTEEKLSLTKTLLNLKEQQRKLKAESKEAKTKPLAIVERVHKSIGEMNELAEKLEDIVCVSRSPSGMKIKKKLAEEETEGIIIKPGEEPKGSSSLLISCDLKSKLLMKRLEHSKVLLAILNQKEQRIKLGKMAESDELEKEIRHLEETEETLRDDITKLTKEIEITGQEKREFSASFSSHEEETEAVEDTTDLKKLQNDCIMNRLELMKVMIELVKKEEMEEEECNEEEIRNIKEKERKLQETVAKLEDMIKNKLKEATTLSPGDKPLASSYPADTLDSKMEAQKKQSIEQSAMEASKPGFSKSRKVFKNNKGEEERVRKMSELAETEETDFGALTKPVVGEERLAKMREVIEEFFEETTFLERFPRHENVEITEQNVAKFTGKQEIQEDKEKKEAEWLEAELEKVDKVFVEEATRSAEEEETRSVAEEEIRSGEEEETRSVSEEEIRSAEEEETRSAAEEETRSATKEESQSSIEEDGEKLEKPPEEISQPKKRESFEEKATVLIEERSEPELEMMDESVKTVGDAKSEVTPIQDVRQAAAKSNEPEISEGVIICTDHMNWFKIISNEYRIPVLLKNRPHYMIIPVNAVSELYKPGEIDLSRLKVIDVASREPSAIRPRLNKQQLKRRAILCKRIPPRHSLKVNINFPYKSAMLKEAANKVLYSSTYSSEKKLSFIINHLMIENVDLVINNISWENISEETLMMIIDLHLWKMVLMDFALFLDDLKHYAAFEFGDVLLNDDDDLKAHHLYSSIVYIKQFIMFYKTEELTTFYSLLKLCILLETYKEHDSKIEEMYKPICKKLVQYHSLQFVKYIRMINYHMNILKNEKVMDVLSHFTDLEYIDIVKDYVPGSIQDNFCI
ncbi:trichohyalin-like [Centruroides sculpturatus]|uniref:trichohyalin-like n=1 Tax=Centruroides sculpturatus TaxID=218467 RepID=UPI000C6DA769|nr:trichohyalin-like [Centruroides sculpturatus]